MIKFFLKSLILPLKAIDAALPRSGLIYDLGCGEGVASFYLAQAAPQRQVIGVDINLKKIRRARQLPNLSFRNTTLTQVNLTQARGCLLSDVLHHLSPSTQRQFLLKSSHQLQSGAVCVIKEINRDDMIRSRLSRLWDWLFYPQDKIHYWSVPKLIATMTQLGFQVTFTPALSWFPGSTNLFVCTKT